MLPELQKSTKKITSNEITDLVLKYQNELEGPTKDLLKEEILLNFRPWIIARLKKSKLATINDLEDGFQIGVIGVLRALGTFKCGKCAFATWADYYMRNEINDYRQSKTLITLPRDIFNPHTKRSDVKGKWSETREEILKLAGIANLQHKTEDNCKLAEIVPDKKSIDVLEELSEIDSMEFVKKKALKCLTEKERKVLFCKYFREDREVISNREIGETLGIPRSSVDEILRNAFKKLRKILVKENL